MKLSVKLGKIKQNSFSWNASSIYKEKALLDFELLKDSRIFKFRSWLILIL
jgi:hypothetical protein